MLMYNDLFVTPKQKELQKLKKFIPAASFDDPGQISSSSIIGGPIRAKEEAIKKP